MALSSYYSNYGEVDFASSELKMMIPPSTIFKEEDPLDFLAQPTHLQPHCYSTYDNLFFDPNDPMDYFLPQENYPQVAENPLFDSFFTLEDYELSSKFLKRQKCFNENDNNYFYSCNNNNNNNNNNGLMSPYYYMETPTFHRYDNAHEQQPLMVPPPPSIFTPPPEYFQESSASAITNGSIKGCNGGRKKESSVTAQSIAARQRRRKISEKTVELSKLIPGGSSKNMNSTAEMLHAAFKYVKFMQAQVGVLQSMSSFQEGHGSPDSEVMEEGIIGQKNMEELVTSGKIQEKLSSMEKCLVPINFVKELAKDESFPSVSDSNINQMLVLD